MRRVVLSLAAVLILGHQVSADVEIYNYVDGKTIAVKVDTKRLLATPSWKKDEANPPVCAKRAIGIAQEIKKALIKSPGRFQWRLVSAKLVRDRECERWYWKIEFEGRLPPSEPPDFPKELDVVVLMDGTAVQPVVTPFQPADQK
jgi:hypothetical protein